MARSNGLLTRLNLRLIGFGWVSVRCMVSKGVCEVVAYRVVVCFDFAKVGADA
jgi:hypothetical protein